MFHWFFLLLRDYENKLIETYIASNVVEHGKIIARLVGVEFGVRSNKVIKSDDAR